MVFVLTQTAHRLWIALPIFGFEGRQVDERFLFGGCFPDACQFATDFLLLPVRNGVHHIALLMHETALPQRRRKQRGEGCQESIMPISDQEVNLYPSSGPQILQETAPAVLTFLTTCPQCQDFSASFQIHSQCC